MCLVQLHCSYIKFMISSLVDVSTHSVVMTKQNELVFSASAPNDTFNWSSFYLCTLSEEF